MAEQDVTQTDSGAAGDPQTPRTYTRTGDEGTTTLGDLSRTTKSDLRIAAYGACEEAAALLGVAVASGTDLSPELVRLLARVQNDLVDVSADICAPDDAGGDDSAPRIDEGYVKRLERACDHFEADGAPSTGFVVPGGTTIGSALHHVRTVVRRAERVFHTALEDDPAGFNPVVGPYLNRLASLLFVLARQANAEHGDTLWEAGQSARLHVELWETPSPEPEQS